MSQFLERYCRTEVINFPVGEERRLTYSRLDGSARLLTSDLTALLDHCRSFRTLEQHAREWLRLYARDLDALDPDFIASVCEQLIPSPVLAFCERVSQM